MMGIGLTRLSGEIGSTDREEFCILVEQRTRATNRQEEKTRTAATVGCGVSLNRVDARR